jgi:glycosyltransferase involved in cell wall biosynthesis
MPASLHPEIKDLSRGLARAGAAPPRVIFVVGGLYTEASGVARIVCDLANGLAQLGAPIAVYTAACRGRPVARHMLRPPNHCIAVPGKWLARLSYAPGLRRILEEAIPQVDVVHNHSLWMLPNHAASAVACRCRKPVVFTAMGFLEPWALARSRWKKRLVGAWFQDRDLRRAACVHVNTVAEMRGVRAYGLENPVAIVPNGVDLKRYAVLPDRSAFDAAYPQAAGKRICLFLSRLHAKKGLVHLIQAWRRVSREYDDWQLVVAGPDDGLEHKARRLVRELHLDTSVTFTGPMFGDKKFEALAAASVFVLPSFSEGFSMAVLEALACRLPALVTPGCNFPEVASSDAGVEVQPTVEDTERGLRALMSVSDAERARMGQNGRRLVESAYTWERVAQQMLGLYGWLAGGGPRPAFVETP